MNTSSASSKSLKERTVSETDFPYSLKFFICLALVIPAGITRARHIKNLREYGKSVSETVLSFKDFEEADEVFMTGNMTKIMPVTAFEDKNYQVGSIAKLARELYWDWSRSQTL